MVRVTLWIALFTPTATLPKLTVDKDKAEGSSPVPVSAAVSGLLVAVVTTVSVDGATTPTAVGVRVRAILQVASLTSVVLVVQVLEGSRA